MSSNFLADINKVANNMEALKAIALIIENNEFQLAVDNINKSIEILNKSEDLGNVFSLNWLGELEEIPNIENSNNGDSFILKYTNGLYSFFNNEWRLILYAKDGEDGSDGESAYDIAVLNGFVGTTLDWLNAQTGKSAYEIAVEDGFTGTVTQWLATFGENGKSAYEIAVNDGETTAQ